MDLQFGKNVELRGEYTLIEFVIFGAIFSMSLIGTVLTVHRLQKKGTSMRERKQVMKMQIVHYVVQLFSLWFLACNIATMPSFDLVISLIKWKNMKNDVSGFKNTEEYKRLRAKTYWIFELSDFLGLLIGIVRLSEPNILRYLLDQLKQLWGKIRYCGKKQKRVKSKRQDEVSD
jgi:hypothetical protein